VKRPTRTPNLAVLVAEYHQTLANGMLAAAVDEAELGGARVTRTFRVPGAYETPLIADRVLALPEVDALIVLGYIERGETLHGEVMGHVVHAALVDASLRRGKPVGLGLIGPGATRKQAEVRKDPSARAAVRAVLRSLGVLSELLGGASAPPSSRGGASSARGGSASGARPAKAGRRAGRSGVKTKTH
jgi:6,7-dimethyl-8-ribityllumazine synthase